MRSQRSGPQKAMARSEAHYEFCRQEARDKKVYSSRILIGAFEKKIEWSIILSLRPILL